MPNVNDPTLAAMDELAYSEFRVRVGVMQIIEYKIWAHDEQDAVNKCKEGGGRETSRSQPEVVSVQVGEPGGAITQTQAEETARVVENAQAQKSGTVESIADAALDRITKGDV
jgi:hypothetical protein